MYNVVPDAGPSCWVRVVIVMLRFGLLAADMAVSVCGASICDEAFNAKSVMSVCYPWAIEVFNYWVSIDVRVIAYASYGSSECAGNSGAIMSEDSPEPICGALFEWCVKCIRVLGSFCM